MLLGHFNPSIFFKSFAITLILTITLIYFIAQHYGHQQKIAWISGCAGHYPEFLFFRFATITGSIMVVLGWMTNHFYLKTISVQHSFNIAKYQPQIPMILGMMGAMLLTISTATLDTGQKNEQWHVHCASSFFVMTFFAIIYNTVLYWIVEVHTKATNKTLLILKTAVAIALLIMTYFDSKAKIYAIFTGQTMDGDQTVSSDLGIILQWVGSYTIGVYLYILSKDVQSFNYQYSLKAN